MTLANEIAFGVIWKDILINPNFWVIPKTLKRVPTATLTNTRQQEWKWGWMPWPWNRRSSYLVQWFSMTKEVQINRLVVYRCKRFQLAHIDHINSPTKVFWYQYHYPRFAKRYVNFYRGVPTINPQTNKQRADIHMTYSFLYFIFSRYKIVLFTKTLHIFTLIFI